jgi:hypothetical protein
MEDERGAISCRFRTKAKLMSLASKNIAYTSRLPDA